MDGPVLYEKIDDVALVTLNRPERLNAWTVEMDTALGHAMASADEDDAVRAVVVTGAGRAFCAGADLEVGEFGGGTAPESQRALWPWQVRKPVIAAMNGHAVGVGMTYALQCDIRFVADNAKLGFVFVRRGAIPELGSHAILPRVVGFSRAAELLLTGRLFSGTEAVAFGLAARSMSADAVLDAALDVAKEIATYTAPVSVAVSKRLLWSALTSTVHDAQLTDEELFATVTKLDDAREGVVSFLEGRRPEWTGRVTSDMPTRLL